MRYVDQVFQDQRILLDGNVFENCKFLECHLSFAGTAGVDFDDCLFRKCNWNFEGAALTTLGFLSALARGTRRGSDYDLFEEIVGALRHGLVLASSTHATKTPAPEPVAP